MMLRLVRRSVSLVPIEARGVTPDRLCSLGVAQIEKLPLQHGNRVEPLAEHFSVSGDPSRQTVFVEGDCSRVKWLGANMTAGTLHVAGSVGMHAGSEMLGGELLIDADADDWLGAEMKGGAIRVHGSARHHAGGAYPGSRRGMSGGTIIIDGACGDGLGSAMRRGLIAVGGCGDFAAASMIAGTIVVFGIVGRYCGAGMKRGSMIVCGSTPELLPSFQFSCETDFPFLALLMRQLGSQGCLAATSWHKIRARRYCGDLLERGLGEFLLPGA